MNQTCLSLRILIVDDNEHFIHLLSILLQEIGIQDIHQAMNYQAGLTAYLNHQPHICLLDINLKGSKYDGIHLAAQIRKSSATTPIIFMTSFFQEPYYLKAKAVRPSSFMNKELSRLKLLQAIELATLELENPPAPSEPPQRTLAPYLYTSNIFLKVGDTYKAIDLKTIDFFFAESKLTYARVSNRNYPTNVQLKVLEKELKPRFLRCHKKFLVNVDAVESVMLKDGKIKIGKELLSIGYAYRKSFLEGLNLLK